MSHDGSTVADTTRPTRPSPVRTIDAPARSGGPGPVGPAACWSTSDRHAALPRRRLGTAGPHLRRARHKPPRGCRPRGLGWRTSSTPPDFATPPVRFRQVVGVSEGGFETSTPP